MIILPKIPFFLRLIPLLLRDYKLDWDETLGVYTVHPQLLHRQIFDFGFRPQTGNRLFFEKRKFQKIETGSRNMLDEKRIQFCSASHILVF